MVPRNNSQVFIDKWGSWWYIREFDYLPAQLEYYPGNIPGIKDFMAYVDEGFFELFKTKEEAMEASYQIRKLRNIKPYSFDKDFLKVKEEQEKYTL